MREALDGRLDGLLLLLLKLGLLVLFFLADGLLDLLGLDLLLGLPGWLTEKDSQNRRCLAFKGDEGREEGGRTHLISSFLHL